MERSGLSSSCTMICIIKGEDVSLIGTSFVAMVLTIKVFACFLAFFVAVGALHAPFPHGKILVYNYHLDAKAGAIEPAAYASQFTLEGTLHVKHDASDPELKNSYHVLLSNVRTGMHNGIAEYNHRAEADEPIDEAARLIRQPFSIIYDENGRFQGVKMVKNEVGWSKNMKMAMASMLHLDLPRLDFDRPRGTYSFESTEKTIHGDCSIFYNVNVKDDSDADELFVTKYLDPTNCTGFAVQSFNHVDIEDCQAEREAPVTMDSRRSLEIERRDGEVLIKKLVAIGGINYLPWNSEAEFHYVLTNATFELQTVLPASGMNLPSTSFHSLPIISDVTYQRPRGQYANNSAEDVTQGRHAINPEITACRLMNVLGEAADYIEENHLEMKSPEWKHGQTLNRILHTMSYLDIGALQHVFNAYVSAENPRDVTIRKLFIGVMPQVGTTATSLFTLDLIRNKKVSDMTAIEILSKLPLTVKVPAEGLLTQMEELVKFNESVSLEVRKASVLCFSSLVYRTFKDASHPEESALLNRHLQDFFERVKSEPTYEMKVLYLMAIKNVRVGKIYDLLGPIIRGELLVSENPVDIRLLAIWAISKAVEDEYRIACNLLWPAMADKALPLKLRVAAYEILMHQARSQADVVRMRRFMASETDEHLYHYHSTTVDNIIKSVDPCKLHLRELVTKVMHGGKPHENIKDTLSSVYTFDYRVEKYNYLEKLYAGVVISEITGVPEVVQLDNIITDGREAVSDITIRLHIEGCDKLLNRLLSGKFNPIGGVMNPRVLEILRKASRDYPRKIHIDLILMHMGRIILASHYNQQTLDNLFDDASRFLDRHKHDFQLNSQHVIYVHLAEKQVISDIGVPVLMESRLPVAASLKVKYNRVPEYEPTTTDLGLDFKFWSQGDYAMSIYNPLADVWHAVRRPTAIDVSLPVRAIVNWNSSTNHLQLSLRRLSASKPPIAGIRMYVKDIVTIDTDDIEALKRSCASCDLRKDVTVGKLDVINRNIDSSSSGLEYSMNIFDCENVASQVTLSTEWYKIVMSETDNIWSRWYERDKVTARQKLNNMLPGSMGSLGILLKVEPSKVYPTSHVDVSLRGSFENGKDVSPSLSSLTSKNLTLHGTVDAISASTNSSARKWSLNVNVDVNQDHTMNMAMVQVVRKTRGEKNLKICLGAQKIYTDSPTDLLRVNASEEIVTSNVTIAAAYSDSEECSYNDTLVTVTMKAELSDEQKKKMSHDLETRACSKDTTNLLLHATPENTVPMTLSCLTEAIRYTTLRKYTVNIAHRNVPELIADAIFTVQYVIRDHKLPNVRYVRERVDAERIKLKVKLPMRRNVVDLSVILPMGSYDATDIPVDIPILKSLGPTVKSPWYWPLDNSRFGLLELVQYTWSALRLCSVYPGIVVTADGTSAAFNISGQWTLVSGDHVDGRFAVFAKSVGKNLAAKIYLNNYEVEVTPDANEGFRATVDGQPVIGLADGVLLPANINHWTLKLTKKNSQVLVQMKEVPLTIVYGPNHIVLAIDTQLQGKVSGLCGRLDRTYLTRIPETFSSPNL